MSEWPPKPPVEQPQQPLSTTQQVSGQEWKILEKAVMASVEEQRRARRWGIFFKILSFLYLLFFILMLSRSCSTVSPTDSGPTSSNTHLAVVDIQGTIASDPQSVNSEMTNRALRRAFEASNSKAVILNINSPGGSPVQSDEIWQEIRYQKTKYPNKKVYAVIGDMGASGAYYIASAADEIYVNPSSIVGSIGVIMPNYGLKGLADKLGVEDRTMTSGENKAILSMTQPVDAKQKAHVQALLDNVHGHFIQAVKDGRGKKLKFAENPDIFSGLFWTGEQSIALGLADKKGSIATIAREIDVKHHVNYTIRYKPLDSLLGQLGTSIGSGIGNVMKDKLEAQSDFKLQ